MPFEFKKKQKKGRGSALDDEGMADRLKQEEKRYRHAVDSEHWICLCFKSEEDRESFVKLTGLPSRRYVTGEDLRQAVEPFRPGRVMRGFARRPVSTVRTPDPLFGVDYSGGDLEAECLAEARALLDAFRAIERPEPCNEVTDSDIWACAVFEDRDDVESFLDSMNLRKHGDKYVDASSWLAELAG